MQALSGIHLFGNLRFNILFLLWSLENIYSLQTCEANGLRVTLVPQEDVRVIRV